jgi:hypothetical protein
LTEPQPLALDQPRPFGALITESLRLYFRHFATFTLIGLAVVVPVEAIVSGVGLGQFGAGFDDTPALAAVGIDLLVQFLVTTPLLAVMATYVLIDLAAAEPPSARRSILAGLEIFQPVFLPVLGAIAVEALAVVTLVIPLALEVASPLVPTLLIPIYLALRWYLVPQGVVVAKARGIGALRESWQATRGFVWRMAGAVLLATLAYGTAAGLLATPIVAAARAADSGALLVLSGVFTQALAAPAVAVVATLLYYDLRARRRAAG